MSAPFTIFVLFIGLLLAISVGTTLDISISFGAYFWIGVLLTVNILLTMLLLYRQQHAVIKLANNQQKLADVLIEINSKV